METTITTQEQRQAIQDLIQVELLKRGYTAKIISFKEVETQRGGPRIEFYSEYFQTTPVIFEKIRVESFSTSVKKKEETREDGSSYEVTRFWICVHVSYNHFNGGSNGCKIFDLSGNFYEGESRINSYTIR